MFNKNAPLKRLAVVVAAGALFAAQAIAQNKQNEVISNGHDITIPVTVHAQSERSRAIAEKLQPGDFSVRENDRVQRIVSVKRAGEAPLTISVLIQDDLVSRVNNEVRGIKEFVRRLPDGSRVMTGYITAGSLSIAQDFTVDRGKAAESLRIVRSSTSGTPFNPYVELVEALRGFDSQPQGRHVVLMVSDGLDVSRGLRSASPGSSLDLDRAITEAQRRGVAIFTFYAPSIGLTSVSHMAMNFGQGSLNRLAYETGGDAFFSGSDFVTFDHYFKEFEELLGRQWLITYRSTNTGSGFRKIEVKTDYDLDLLHPAGYRVRGETVHP